MEHHHAPILIVDAPKIDEDEVNEGVEFIDKYITRALPYHTKYQQRKCRPTIMQQLVERKNL